MFLEKQSVSNCVKHKLLRSFHLFLSNICKDGLMQPYLSHCLFPSQHGNMDFSWMLLISPYPAVTGWSLYPSMTILISCSQYWNSRIPTRNFRNGHEWVTRWWITLLFVLLAVGLKQTRECWYASRLYNPPEDTQESH